MIRVLHCLMLMQLPVTMDKQADVLQVELVELVVADVITAVPLVVVDSIPTEEAVPTEQEGYPSQMEVTEETMVLTLYVLEDLEVVAELTGTPVAVAVAVATLVVQEVSIMDQPEAEAVEVPIIMEPTKPTLEGLELVMAL